MYSFQNALADFRAGRSNLDLRSCVNFEEAPHATCIRVADRGTGENLREEAVLVLVFSENIRDASARALLFTFAPAS